jgi:flavin-dependent dehydrogenase
MLDVVLTRGRTLIQLQAVFDLESHQLVFGRVVILGDAAFVARPHVAAGVTKAALDAQCLADALVAAGNDAEPVAILVRDISDQVTKYGSLAKLPTDSVGNTRNDMYLVSEAIRFLMKDKASELSEDDLETLKAYSCRSIKRRSSYPRGSRSR